MLSLLPFRDPPPLFSYFSLERFHPTFSFPSCYIRPPRVLWAKDRKQREQSPLSFIVIPGITFSIYCTSLGTLLRTWICLRASTILYSRHSEATRLLNIYSNIVISFFGINCYFCCCTVDTLLCRFHSWKRFYSLAWCLFISRGHWTFRNIIQDYGIGFRSFKERSQFRCLMYIVRNFAKFK